MNKITNEEFHEAFCNLPFHYAPDGYWDRVNEQRKNHRFVGKNALINNEIWKCVRAEDSLVIFQPLRGGNTEYIVSGNNVEKIKWKE